MTHQVAGALAALFLAVAGVRADSPDALIFQGTAFKKAFSDKSAAGPYFEYLPKGQSLKSWTKLMGYYDFPKLRDPKDAAQNLARLVKKANPLAQSQVIENPSTGEAIVDFVTWPEDVKFVEFNIWRYRKAPGGGLVALQYAERAYDDQQMFLKRLRDRRPKLLDAMAKQNW
jgi:hypothetical protein